MSEIDGAGMFVVIIKPRNRNNRNSTMPAGSNGYVFSERESVPLVLATEHIAQLVACERGAADVDIGIDV